MRQYIANERVNIMQLDWNGRLIDKRRERGREWKAANSKEEQQSQTMRMREAWPAKTLPITYSTYTYAYLTGSARTGSKVPVVLGV